MQGILGLTGTPGTGKKTVAPLVARGLGIEARSLDSLAVEHGLVTKRRGESEVDVARLKELLRGRDRLLVYGHLLPSSVYAESLSNVAILRCEPAVLKRRLLPRGYGAGKLMDNVEAELIGLVSADAFGAFGEGKAFDVDVTRATPEGVARTILAVVTGKQGPPPRVDWTVNYGSGAKLRSLLSRAGP